MRKPTRKWLMLAIAMALLAVGCGPAAAKSPAVGTWKATLTIFPSEISLFLIKITEKDGKLEGKVEASPVPDFAKAEVEDIKATDSSVTVKVKGSSDGPTFNFTVTPGKDEKKLLGTCDFGRGPMFARLEKTEDTKIEPADAQKPVEGFQDLRQAVQKTDAKEKGEALKKIVEKNADSVLGYYARLELITALAASGASSEDIKAEADKAAKLAESYNPVMKKTALEQANANEVKGLKSYVSALKKDGKTEELKTAEPRLAKIEKELDEAYLKTAVPFKAEPFKGRKDKSDRVVLYELFTGSECPPCVAADVAFDALAESYKPTDVVFLEYHLHIPRPDALTNKASEERGQFYDIPGTPAAFIDGKEGPHQGGGKANSEAKYKEVVSAFADELGKQPQAKLNLTATHKGDAIEIVADASDVKEPGENVKLRVVLVEEVVRYPGGNGQRFHHHVVRAFPGGVEGMTLKEATGKQNVKVNVKDLAKDLNDYLNEYGKKVRFAFEDRPMDLKKLKVVAFVQNDKTKEIYQAAQVDIE